MPEYTVRVQPTEDRATRAIFCRDPAGRWSIESRTAYMRPVVDHGVEGSGAGSGPLMLIKAKLEVRWNVAWPRSRRP